MLSLSISISQKEKLKKLVELVNTAAVLQKKTVRLIIRELINGGRLDIKQSVQVSAAPKLY